VTAGSATALVVDEALPAAARGDREAFARLVEATRNSVASIALAIVADAELARDVAQDVFLAAWRDLGALREPRSFLPWLRQATRHRAYHVLRTERRRRRRVTLAESDEQLAAAVDPRPGIDSRLVADEDRRLIATVLDELPDETREVVTLFYWEGESSARVAELLGLSEAAVRKRVSRARRALRASLLDRFAEASRRAAPGAALTTAVMTALSVAAPASAAAGTSLATASIGANTPWLAKLASLGGSILLPAAGGAAGVLFGTRQLRRRARSVTELAALRRFEAASLALVLATAIAFPTLWIATGSRWAPVATFVLFVATLGAFHAFWLPRIVAERHALERLEDPERARRARARERRAARLGWTLGLLCGTAGLLAGLFLD
jgi:RNA polymerase sigma factor (sigma-70 family)